MPTYRRVPPSIPRRAVAVVIAAAIALTLWAQLPETSDMGTIRRMLIEWPALILLFGGGWWIYSRIAPTRTVEVCSHCGVIADPEFRVCRSCGRVK